MSTLSNTYRVYPLLSSPGGLFISFERGGGGLFYLENIRVSSLSKELESVKGQVQTFEGHAAKDQEQMWTFFWLVNKPSWISPHEVLQSWLINNPL